MIETKDELAKYLQSRIATNAYNEIKCLLSNKTAREIVELIESERPRELTREEMEKKKDGCVYFSGIEDGYAVITWTEPNESVTLLHENGTSIPWRYRTYGKTWKCYTKKPEPGTQRTESSDINKL